jgi:DNA-binding CsgD family transcriptional regulator
MSVPVVGFSPFFQGHPAGMVIFDLEGKVIDANPALARTLKCRSEEYPISPSTRKEIAKRLQLDNSAAWGEIRTGSNLVNREMELDADPEDRIAVLVNCSIMKHRADGNHLALASVVNVSEMKAREKNLLLLEERTAARVSLLEEMLESTGRDLENSKRELQESYQSLESLNYAMKLLMMRLEDQRKDVEDRIAHNFKLTIQPVLEHMKARDLPESPDHLLETLDYNIRHITSLFGVKLGADRNRLSPREIQVCQMIRAGKNTRNIAKALGLSYQTVIVHRKNIRKKLGLTNRKQNLVTFIMQNLDLASRSRSRK